MRKFDDLPTELRAYIIKCLPLKYLIILRRLCPLLSVIIDEHLHQSIIIKNEAVGFVSFSRRQILPSTYDHKVRTVELPEVNGLAALQHLMLQNEFFNSLENLTMYGGYDEHDNFEFPSLRKLVMSYIPDPNNSLTHIDRRFPFLDSLSIRKADDGKTTYVNIDDLKLPYLRKLELNGISFEDKLTFERDLGQLTNLQKLKICSNENELVLSRHLPSITELESRANNYLMLSPSNLSNLRSLITDKSFIYDVQDFCKLSVLKKLKKLHIWCPIYSYSPSTISDLPIHIIPNLCYLELHNVQISRSFDKLTNLKIIKLERCQVLVNNPFPNCRGLEQLQTNNCTFQDYNWICNYPNLDYLQLKQLVYQNNFVSLPDLSMLKITTLDISNDKSHVNFQNLNLPLSLKRIYITIQSSRTKGIPNKFPSKIGEFSISNKVAEFNYALLDFNIEEELPNKLKLFLNHF